VSDAAGRTQLKRPPSTPTRLFADFIGSRALLAVTSLVGTVLMTRTVGASVYGVYATAVGFVTLLYIFTDLGASQILIREGAHEATRQSAIRVYLWSRLVLIAISVLGGGIVAFIAFDAETRPAALLSLLLLVFAGPTFASPLGALMHDLRAFRTSVIIQGVAGLAFVATALFVLDLRTPVALVAASVLAALLSTIYAAWSLRAWITGPWQSVRDAGVWSAVRATTVVGLASILVSVYYRIDGILLLRISGAEQAGLYAAAYRLVEQARLVPHAVLLPLSPELARQLRGTGRVDPEFDTKLLRVSLSGGLGLGLAAAAVANWAVALIMGPQFDESAELFVGLSIALAPSIIAYVGSTKAISGFLERPYLLLCGLGVIVNVALNLLLIPEYGARGAVAATIVTEVVVHAGVLTVTASVSRPGYRRALLVCLAASSAAAVAKLAAMQGPIVVDVATTLALGTLAFVLLGIAFRTFRSLDIATGSSPSRAAGP
jgi:O-antigen/teichoic acid export membrane protein